MNSRSSTHELSANSAESRGWADALKQAFRLPSKCGCGGDCGQTGRSPGGRMTANGSARVGVVPGSAAPSAAKKQSRSAPSARAGAASAPHVRLPAGLSAVLGVLSSSAVVIDSHDRVLQASQTARSFGLVEGEELVVGELLALARQVRRDGEIREGEIDITTRGIPSRTTSFAVRVAPLGPGGRRRRPGAAAGRRPDRAPPGRRGAPRLRGEYQPRAQDSSRRARAAGRDRRGRGR